MRMKCQEYRKRVVMVFWWSNNVDDADDEGVCNV